MNGLVNTKTGLFVLAALALAVIAGMVAKDRRGNADTVAQANSAPVGAEANKRVFMRNCKICHTAEANGKHKAGPNLWGVAGASKAAKAGYRYSKSLATAGGIWSDENLDAFIANPKVFVPKTKMTFKGLKKASDRAAVIAFLRTQGALKPAQQDKGASH